MDALWNLLTSLVMAVVTAVLTVRLSLRQFRSTRWWEQKIQVYTTLFDTLHQSIAAAEHIRSVLASKEPEPTSDYLARMLDQWGDAHDSIYRAVNTGQFILSPAAVDAVRELWNAQKSWKAREDSAANAKDEYQQHLSYVAAHLIAARKCLDVMPTIARQDLGLESRPWCCFNRRQPLPTAAPPSVP